MRLKQTTNEATAPIYSTQGIASAARLETSVDASTASTASTGVIAPEALNNTLHKAQEVASVLPQGRSMAGVACFGLLWGAIACFLTFVWLASLTLTLDNLALLLLPYLFFSFGLGWWQKNTIKGAVSGVVLGLTTILGFIASFALLPSLLAPQQSESTLDALYLFPFTVLAFVVLAGALGGACGRAWQTRRARSRKNNR